MSKVSVIMPAYNAEKFIEGSVKSVLSQSHADLELIVIDDGSCDSTAEILRRMAAEDARLRPVSVQNGGPAMARNRALELASPEAEYVMFIDADDALSPDAVEYALKGASGADLVILGYAIESVDGSRREYSEPEQSIDRSQLGQSLSRLYQATLSASLIIAGARTGFSFFPALKKRRASRCCRSANTATSCTRARAL